MKREFLEALGLGKENIDSIMAENGKDIEAQKSKVESLTTNVGELTDQLKQRDKDIKDLQKQAGDNEEVKTKLTELETKYKEEKSALETKLQETAVKNAIKLALVGKVHDANLVSSLISTDGIELDDKGTVKGSKLDDTIKQLKESKAFLFTEEQTTVKGAKPAGGKPPEKDDLTVASTFAAKANERTGVTQVEAPDPWK